MLTFSDYQYHAQLVNALEMLPYQGKTTRIDRAIVKASKELMTVEGGRRKDIPGVMVIMTDGRQTQDFDVTPLEQAAAISEEMGITTLVIGIGELADVNELRKMTSQDGDVFLASSPRALSSFAQPVATRICNAAGTFNCCLIRSVHSPCSHRFNTLFVVISGYKCQTESIRWAILKSSFP